LPLWSRRWPFLGYSIEAAPLDSGVYALWKDDKLIYIGVSEESSMSIRSGLLEHFRQSEGKHIPMPDHYSWEVAADPQKRKFEMLEQFRDLHGKLPLLNAHSSPTQGYDEPS